MIKLGVGVFQYTKNDAALHVWQSQIIRIEGVGEEEGLAQIYGHLRFSFAFKQTARQAHGLSSCRCSSVKNCAP